jgi:cell division protein FtsB
MVETVRELECAVADLLQQIKERDAEIDRLRAENAELRAEIDKLKDYIDFHGLRACPEQKKEQ